MSEPTVPAQDGREGPRCLQHPAQVQLVSELKVFRIVILSKRSAPTSPPSHSSTSLSSTSPRGQQQNPSQLTRPLGHAKKFLSSDGIRKYQPLHKQKFVRIIFRFWQKVFELLNGGAEALIFLCSSSTSSHALLLLLLGVFQGLVKPSLLLGQEGQRSSKKLNTLGQFPHSREWSGKESGTTNGSQQYGWSSVEACIEETTNDEEDTGRRRAGIEW